MNEADAATAVGEANGDGDDRRSATPPAADASGHRARLRRRILDRADDAVAPHEVLEYLLATVIPRRDTKPLAKSLIQAFGGLPGVLSADPGSLMRHPGMGEGAVAAVRVVQRAAVAMLRGAVQDRPILGSWQALLDYLRAHMAHQAVESVRVLFLNSRNMLIADEELSRGTVAQAAIHPRAVLSRALQLEASSIILVHNHPSGDPQPSRQDIALTKAIIDAGKALDIVVHDHLIMGAHGHSSFRALGLL